MGRATAFPVKDCFVVQPFASRTSESKISDTCRNKEGKTFVKVIRMKNDLRYFGKDFNNIEFFFFALATQYERDKLYDRGYLNRMKRVAIYLKNRSNLISTIEARR